MFTARSISEELSSGEYKQKEFDDYPSPKEKDSDQGNILLCLQFQSLCFFEFVQF